MLLSRSRAPKRCYYINEKRVIAMWAISAHNGCAGFFYSVLGPPCATVIVIVITRLHFDPRMT